MPDAIELTLLRSISRRGRLILNNKSASPIPEPIVQLQQRLGEFRGSRPHRTKLPETLWHAAVELARQHGVYSVAHPLRLDYTGPKKRLDGVPIPPQKAVKPGIVQLVAARREN